MRVILAAILPLVRYDWIILKLRSYANQSFGPIHEWIVKDVQDVLPERIVHSEAAPYYTKRIGVDLRANPFGVANPIGVDLQANPFPTSAPSDANTFACLGPWLS